MPKKAIVIVPAAILAAGVVIGTGTVLYKKLSFKTGPDVFYSISAKSTGIDIYTPPKDSDWGYMYGPSIIMNNSKSIDVWFSSLPDNIGWDSIRLKHSDDGGKTWSDAKVVLQPTEGSQDAYSTCDPGAIKIGSYYYVGYTSTTDKNMTDNNVYIARAKSPSGPYEKWTGSGWGDEPAPVTNYNEDPKSFGCGEPSFVLLKNTVYMYYSWDGPDGSYTKLCTARADDPNWPAKLKDQGAVITRVSAEDSTDIKYCDRIGKFIGVSTAQRFTKDSYIRVYESNDGRHFQFITKMQSNILPYCHNCGLSGDQSGHIDFNAQNYISYAYEVLGSDGKPKWGWWPTRFAPIEFSLKPVSVSGAGSK